MNQTASSSITTAAPAQIERFRIVRSSSKVPAPTIHRIAHSWRTSNSLCLDHYRSIRGPTTASLVTKQLCVSCHTATEGASFHGGTTAPRHRKPKLHAAAKKCTRPPSPAIQLPRSNENTSMVQILWSCYATVHQEASSSIATEALEGVCAFFRGGSLGRSLRVLLPEAEDSAPPTPPSLCARDANAAAAASVSGDIAPPAPAQRHAVSDNRCRTGTQH